VVEDLDLLHAWGNGDRAAARTLLDRYLDPLARFFRGKSSDVDDAVQETMTRCLALRKALEPGSSFRAYLFAVARNLLYEQFRRASRMGTLDPEQMSLVDLSPTPSSVVQRRRDQRLMLAAMRRIPLDSQLALELFYWEGLGVAEIGHVLDVPVGTVKSRLHRARAQLRTELERVGKDDPLYATTLGELDAWESARDRQR
jgi:RNA polymerase sigma-70 factor (ECF subfamily)